MFSKREVVQETPSLVAKRLGWGSCVAFDCFDSGQGGEPLRFGMHGDKTKKVIKNIKSPILGAKPKENGTQMDNYLVKPMMNR